MNKKRLIITSFISIFLVAVLMMGSTYSIFTSSDIDENSNIYTTGNINISYTLSEEAIKITNISPMSENQAELMIKPYQITISNTGTVPYQFDLILDDTTAGEVIDYQYIMIKVGELDSKPLSECENNILKKEIIVPTNGSVTVDVRILLAENIQSTEIGKSFYAKLSVDELAIYDNSTDIDNSILKAEPIKFLKDVEPNSYVTFLGNNGCDSKNGSCNGQNANYENNTSIGYCYQKEESFNTNGWRLAYIKDSIPYLISAGSPECLCTNSDGTASTTCDSKEENTEIEKHLYNLNEASLKYCNSTYAYNNTCDSNSAWNFNLNDFDAIMKNNIMFESCNETTSTDCGKDNVLINNGSYYWITKNETDSLTSNIFNWNNTNQYWQNSDTTSSYGIRPVLKLNENIIVIGGDGTSTNPYRLATYQTKIKDLSQNTNHGMNQNTKKDLVNGTITTDGTSTYIDAGLLNYNFNNKITLISKVKFNEIDTNISEQYIFGNGLTGFFIKNNCLAFNISIDGANKTFYSTITPTINTWYNLVGTYDGTNIKFYINGEEAILDTSIPEATNSITGNMTVSTNSFFIGLKPQNLNISLPITDSGVNATFDDVLIYNRVLTSDEVMNDFREEITSINQKDLLLHYNFKEKVLNNIKETSNQTEQDSE